MWKRSVYLKYQHYHAISHVTNLERNNKILINSFSPNWNLRLSSAVATDQPPLYIFVYSRHIHQSLKCVYKRDDPMSYHSAKTGSLTPISMKWRTPNFISYYIIQNNPMKSHAKLNIAIPTLVEVCDKYTLIGPFILLYSWTVAKSLYNCTVYPTPQ